MCGVLLCGALRQMLGADVGRVVALMPLLCALRLVPHAACPQAWLHDLILWVSYP
jgi:hypothetical protein